MADVWTPCGSLYVVLYSKNLDFLLKITRIVRIVRPRAVGVRSTLQGPKRSLSLPTVKYMHQDYTITTQQNLHPTTRPARLTRPVTVYFIDIVDA